MDQVVAVFGLLQVAFTKIVVDRCLCRLIRSPAFSKEGIYDSVISERHAACSRISTLPIMPSSPSDMQQTCPFPVGLAGRLGAAGNP
jgi:hypothetical protein